MAEQPTNQSAETSGFSGSDNAELLASAQSQDEYAPSAIREASEAALEKVLLEDAANIIATVANNESKALALAAMVRKAQGLPLTAADIHSAFLEIQGNNPTWLPHPSSTPKIAEQSFAKIGTVVKTTREDEWPKIDYSVSQYGEKVGLAAVGLFLDLSLKYPDVHLYDIFGTTNTRSEEMRRSPYTRLQILAALTQDPREYKSAKDIAGRAGIPIHYVSRQGMDLEDAGLVEQIHFKPGQSDTSISFPDPERFQALKLRSDANDITRAMIDELKSRLAGGAASVSQEELIDAIIGRLESSEVADIRRKVSYQLPVWKQAGLIATTSNFSKEHRSNLRLNAENIDVINDLMAAVQALVEGDEGYLAWGQRRALEIVNNVEAVNYLLAKSIESSPSKNRSTRSEFQALLLGLLSDNWENARDIVKKIEAMGKPINKNSTQHVLDDLIKQGLAESELRGKTLFYRRSSSGIQP